VTGEWTAKDTPSANATPGGGWTAAGIEFPSAEASETSTPNPEARTKGTATYATADLHDLAAKVASRDDMRPVLTGLRFEPDAIVATDSYRLGVITADGPRVGVTAPAAAVRIVTEKAGEWTALRTEPEADPEKPGSVIGLETVTKAGSAVTMEISAISGQFPNYSQLFPEQYECSAKMDTRAALAAAKKVKRWSEKNRPAVIGWSAEAVTVEFPNENGPSVKPQPITNGTRPEYAPPKTDKEGNTTETEPPRIGVNPEFLHGGLEFVGENATLEAIGPLRPMNLSSESRRYLLMPIRLSE
jgi:DNA polymerase III sliding clamp (beta) subunit (PCNA family)